MDVILLLYAISHYGPLTVVYRNIWAPNTQSKVVKAIGHRYGFSARLMAVLCTTPPVNVNKQSVDVDSPENVYLSSGIVAAERGIGIARDNTLPATKLKSTNFYDIAKSFTSYQSVDIGDKCALILCYIGCCSV